MNQPVVCPPSSLPVRTSRRRVLRGFVAGTAAMAFIAGGWTIEAAAHPDESDLGAPSGDIDRRLNLVFVFGEPADSNAFEQYYASRYLPRVLQLPHLQRFEGYRALSDASGGQSSFYRIATLAYANQADMEFSASSPEGVETLADVAKYATGGVTATIVHDITAIVPNHVAAQRQGVDPRTP